MTCMGIFTFITQLLYNMCVSSYMLCVSFQFDGAAGEKLRHACSISASSQVL